MDGTWLALAVAGLLAVTGGRQRGSRALSPFQKRLLYVAKAYRSDPEVAIRTIDTAVSAGTPGRVGNALPGTQERSSQLLADIRFIQGDQATLGDYLAYVEDEVKKGVYLDRDLRTITPVARLVPWLGIQIRALVQRERRGELPTPKNVSPPHERVGFHRAVNNDCLYGQDPFTGQRVALSASEWVVLRRLGGMVTGLPRIADWVAVTHPMLEGGRDPTTGRKIKPLTWGQAKVRSDAWHRFLKQTLPTQITPGTVVYQGEDGWTVQRLDERACAIEEGQAVGHCLGASIANYWSSVERGDTALFSLRRPNGLPVITFEVSLGRVQDHHRVIQAKGHRDRLVGQKKSQFMEECLHTRAWLEQWLGRALKRTDVTSDLHLCQSVLLRLTGWDRIDHTLVGQTGPIPSVSEWRRFQKTRRSA